jgi:aarF domain-containing kinase
MAAVLPKEYTESLSRLLDNAKTYEYKVVEKIIRDELGEGVVIDVEKVPVGSASLAQVHRGRYAETGELVAIKIQKPNVSVQAYWDLWMYRLLVRILEWSFDIPLYWSVGFTCSHFMSELDFTLEGRHSELAKSQLEHGLGSMVYVPRVIHSTPKVLLTEWIDDTVMISSVKGLTERGFDCKGIIMDATKIFGYQIFKTGHVHCDPHPGNLLVRQHPDGVKGHHQIVLIDHGLYVDLPECLRRDYARLWVAMVPPSDRQTIEEICASWGIGSIDLFQAIVRAGSNMKPKSSAVNGDGVDAIENVVNEELKKRKNRNAAEMNALIKDNLKKLLQDTSKFPKELILVGRCMNYIRAANWTHGSPIDRVSVLANIAQDSVTERTPSKSWLISAGSAILRYLPGGSAYHKDVNSA